MYTCCVYLLFRFRFGWARILGCLDGEECKSCGWAGGEGNKARTLLYWGLHPRIVHSIEVVEDHIYLSPLHAQ